MRGIEDDRGPPLGRLHDLERGRQLAIKLGHRRAPSLENPLLWATGFCQKNGGFCVDSLSVITTLMPREKSSRPSGTYLKGEKGPSSFPWDAFRHRNSQAGCPPRSRPFTRNLPSVGLSVRIDLPPDRDSTTNRHA